MSDQLDLVRRCQEGELAAFTELFRQLETQAYRLSRAILKQEQDAEDAVQEAYLRVFERIKSYEGTASFKTWFTSIVVNVCRDRLRRQKVRRALSLEWLRGIASQYNLVEEVARRHERQALWAYVDRLDDKYRLPVILHYYQHLNCNEVADVLCIPVSTVYSRLNMARMQLRAMASEDMPEAELC